jgi:hypothetical protein
MNRAARLVYVLAAASALGGCALRASDVPPAPVSASEFAGWPCSRIEDELDNVQRHATRVAFAFDERAGANIVAMGVGMSVFWPALLAMRSTGEDRSLLAQLKGRHEALLINHKAKACQGSAASAGVVLPLAPGDQLVYEQRVAQQAAAQQIVLRVQDIGRESVVLAAAGAAGAPDTVELWRSDRRGNLKAAPRGPVWPQLLRNDLELGQVLSGELQDPQELGNRARVRGQVVAVGPQTIADRRFDVAVIDLFGDAQGGETSTRLDGVLVVDRTTGVLLRLDLYSNHPSFRMQRRLARVSAQP